VFGLKSMPVCSRSWCGTSHSDVILNLTGQLVNDSTSMHQFNYSTVFSPGFRHAKLHYTTATLSSKCMKVKSPNQ